FLIGPPAKTADDYLSRLYVGYFRETQFARENRLANAWKASTVPSIVARANNIVGLIGMLGESKQPDQGELPPLLLFRYLPLFVQVFGASQDQGPPAVPLLAVRAARRAVAANPDSATAHLALAQATTLVWLAQEDFWATISPRSRLSDRQQLRVLQVITAAHQ